MYIIRFFTRNPSKDIQKDIFKYLWKKNISLTFPIYRVFAEDNMSVSDRTLLLLHHYLKKHNESIHIG